MTVQELVEQFGGLWLEDQKAVIRGILPGFCESMNGRPEAYLDMFLPVHRAVRGAIWLGWFP